MIMRGRVEGGNVKMEEIGDGKKKMSTNVLGD